jgi:single-strand DNA-binding protein
MNDTYITLVGVVATKPEAKMHDGIRLLSFRLVSTARRFDKPSGSWVDGDSTWVTVTCWRHLAVNVEESVLWKDRVIVHGKMRTREWTPADGVRRSSISLTAESVGPDLGFGTAVFTRRPRLNSVPPAQLTADELAEQVENRPTPSLAELEALPALMHAASLYDDPEDDRDDEDDETGEFPALDGAFDVEERELVGAGPR